MPTRTVRFRRGLAAVAVCAVSWAGSVGSARAMTTYVVEPGDGFYAIAAATGADLRAILDANDLRLDSVIHPGQRLMIPGATAAPAESAESSPASGASSRTSGTVTVRAGDGLYAVARRAGVSLERLLSANGLTITSIIHPGQRLDVPGSASAASAPATSAPADTSQSSGTHGPATPLALPRDVADRSLVAVFRHRASEAGIPADLLMAVCYRESRWNVGAVSPAGASGICQLMPGTAAWVARDLIGLPGLDSMDADDNIRMGAHLLGWLLRRADGDVGRALAMYGQGVAGVERDGVSEFSQKYIREIADLRRRFD
jgi:LysM repeat protein